MRIYFLIGQSNTGKDTISAALLENNPSLNRYVYNTTRPMRNSEVDGVTYNFVTKEQFEEDQKEGKVVESRLYHSEMGDVYYYTPVLPSSDKSYIITGTVDMCKSCVDYYGEKTVVPVFIEVDDRTRLMRGIAREDKNSQNYKEVARRFYDEFLEYNEENLNSVPNLHRIDNNRELSLCVKDIEDLMESLEKEEDREMEM